jgi:hypothetical protein
VRGLVRQDGTLDMIRARLAYIYTLAFPAADAVLVWPTRA